MAFDVFMESFCKHHQRAIIQFRIIHIRINLVFFILFFLFACSEDSQTDITPPWVAYTQPNNGATSITTDTTVFIVYDKNIVLSDNYQITVNNEQTTASTNGKKLTIDCNLQAGTTYTINVSENSIQDIAGNYAKEYSFSFTTSAVTEPTFQIDDKLVTATPSIEANNVYEFLKENFQSKIISGTMANYNTNIIEAEWVHDQTGSWPALTGFDLIDYTRNWSWISYTDLVDNAITWWGNNGLVTISWHWRDPSRITDEFYSDKTNFDITKIYDENSDEYKAMIDDIDEIASYLQQLKDAGVPVLWRPLHEAAGGWFWWGSKGAESCVSLWRLLFDRLVNVHGLNNLIWVWTTNTDSDALDWYPGDNYVDIIGMDIYPGENQHGSQYIQFDKVKEIFNGKKIITLSECGSVPDPALMMEYGDTWSWFMPWNGNFTESDNHNGADWWNKIFSYEYVLIRETMPNLK